jgi:membrane protein
MHSRAAAALFGGPGDARAVNLLVSLGISTLLFAAMLKFLPGAPVAWRDVWFGAGVTALRFVLGKHVIGLYLGRAGIGSSYGAAGSVVVMTVCVYYAAMTMLSAAGLTAFPLARISESHLGHIVEVVAPVPVQALVRQERPRADGVSMSPRAQTRRCRRGRPADGPGYVLD